MAIALNDSADLIPTLLLKMLGLLLSLDGFYCIVFVLISVPLLCITNKSTKTGGKLNSYDKQEHENCR